MGIGDDFRRYYDYKLIYWKFLVFFIYVLKLKCIKSNKIRVMKFLEIIRGYW